VTASDPSHYKGLSAGIKIKKYTNTHDADTPPGPSIAEHSKVTWTYVVTNTGEIPLANVGVTDNRGVSVSCPKTSLAAGESMTCTAYGKAIKGQYSNIGKARGTPTGGVEIEATDPSHYKGIDICLQGCSPGYWKYHTSSWVGYNKYQKVKDVFSQAWRYPAGSETLLQALAFDGGWGVNGAAETLLREATAALLNAAHPNIDYPRSVSDVLADVNNALASQNRDTMLALAESLDHDNNRSCPLH
jgi:hypothetical protein